MREREATFVIENAITAGFCFGGGHTHKHAFDADDDGVPGAEKSKVCRF